MHVQPISTFRLFQEGHLLRNSIAIFVLTTLFYFIGAELRLVHELSLFWPLNGVMAGVFARYVWLNRLHYYAISYVAMLVYDAITTEWGLVSLAINFSNMMFIVTVALLVARDKRLGKNKYEPVSALPGCAVFLSGTVQYYPRYPRAYYSIFSFRSLLFSCCPGTRIWALNSPSHRSAFSVSPSPFFLVFVIMPGTPVTLKRENFGGS